MAYRRSRGKTGKIQPAVQTLAFEVTIPAGSTTDVMIDLSQCASIVNRRFYRQGLLWAVGGIKLLSDSQLAGAPPNGVVTVRKLPQTWVMSNAWEKGFRAWQKMNNAALEETPSVKPKFLDFKIYADADHHSAGFGNNLLPVNFGGVATPGEWESSKYVVPTGTGTQFGQITNFEVIAVGASYPGAAAGSGLDAVSLIEGYAASRALPEIVDPNVPDDADDVTGATPENWMGALFNEGTGQDEKVLQDMISENNQAPYPYEDDGTNLDTMYPGGANQLPGLQIHDIEYVTGTTIGGTSLLKGGVFPCGLIAMRFVNRDTENGLNQAFTIDLVPGHHRGYMCTPMTDM